MATLATFINRFVGSKTLDEAISARREQADLFRLRAIPNEDIYFYVKSIDNSRVVREADPDAPRACWRMFATACVISAMLVALLLPGAYSMMCGYQIEALREQHQTLLKERRALELEEATLLSPGRLEELARLQKFIDPAPGAVVYLSSQDGSLALNVASEK